MTARTTFLALAAGFMLMLLTAATPTVSEAGACCTPPTPPACCTPPKPPTKPPVCCQNGGGGNVNVNVSANVTAVAVAGAGSSSNAGSTVYYGGGGGGGGFIAPSATGVTGGLNVEGGKKRTAYQASRSRFRKIIIRAVCVDDKETPHPASQLFPEQDVDDAYDGELYRCIAGTRMQYTIADWTEKAAFDGGQTAVCAKGEALYHVPGKGPGSHGSLVCRPQAPARDCNERSLLRRFGAGIKVLTIVSIETYTEYREESSGESVAGGMSLDGGVGGYVY